MADIGDFLSGFLGSIAQQRTDMNTRKADDEQWERRQRLLSDLEVDQKSRMNKLEKKDGNTYKDPSGAWVTEVLDGGGNVTGTRPASPAEIAEVESATLGVDMKKDEFGYRGTERRMREEGHAVDMDYKRQSLALQRERIALDRAAQAAAAAGNTMSVEGTVDEWLDSSQGELATKAYTEQMARVVGSNPNLSGRPAAIAREGGEGEQQYAAQQRLKSSIIEHLRALPPEERPKNETELKALIARIAGVSGTSLDRYAQPNN